MSVHSGHEARRLLPKLDDIAIILLDVVMETDDAGLRLVHLFRDSSDGRSATLADGRSDWPTVGLAQPSV
jgi:CheY-like chemotaxis protein